MKHRSRNRFALVCDYVPRQCGIATFSHDVYKTLTAPEVGAECIVVAVNDRPEGYEYPPEVRFEIAERDINSYRRAADFLNFSDAEVVCVQHEFGIYGGPAGSHILALLRHLRVPAVVHLHTILEEPNADQRRVMDEMIRRAARFIVMSERGRRMLQEIYRVEPDRIDLIPHGIPDMPFVDPSFYKDQFGVEGKKVLLTFGLLSPGKGIEYVLQALPEVIKVEPNLVYIILGATHPNLIREQGETYRLRLERMVAELGLKKHVIFYNRFVELDELKEFLGAADIYITPYLNKAQITSGTLAYAFGCGKAVISTPYWHAEELLADGRGVLVPFRDSAAIARALIDLLTDPVKRDNMRKQAYLLGRQMVWSQLAHAFLESFRKAREVPLRQVRSRLALDTQEQQPRELPLLRLDHLRTLTDNTGHSPARRLLHSQPQGGLLHRRQRAGPAADRPAGTNRRRHARSSSAGFSLRRVSQRRVHPGHRTIPQFHELRSPVARQPRVGRLPGPGPLGPWRLCRPIPASGSPAMGRPAL
ncbi:MAG: hypothetical protein KatS3mg132_172 [Limisphaera sp.]|nr:MAG: hypothetical protein KatS3mg132_172 [Limisphaera sp.]